jgi:hypothetical protein
MCWFSVCSTSETHRRYTGSQYGRKPDCKAVATLDRHWKENTQLHANNGWLHIKLRTVKTVHVYDVHHIQIQKNHNCFRAIMQISTFGYAVSYN